MTGVLMIVIDCGGKGMTCCGSGCGSGGVA